MTEFYNVDTSTKTVLKTYTWDHDPGPRPVADLQIITKTLKVYQTDAGQYYIKYELTDGQHRRYLGWKTGHTYEEMTVFTNSDKTRFWFVQLADNILINRVKLPAALFT